VHGSGAFKLFVAAAAVTLIVDVDPHGLSNLALTAVVYFIGFWCAVTAAAGIQAIFSCEKSSGSHTIYVSSLI